MASSSQEIVVGIGELLWDCFADVRRPGGAPANVAFHADQLACRGVICSRVGDDADGRELRSELENHGLDTGMIQVDPRLPTGRVIVDTSDPARPSYHIHEGVAWDALAFDASVERLMKSAAAICVGSLAQRSVTSRITIRRCLESASDALRVFDVNLRRGGYDRESIEATLRQTRVVKLNLEEVAVLDGILSVGSADSGRSTDPSGSWIQATEFGRRLIERFDLELVCVTRAERGCLLVSRTECVDVPGIPVREADAVGAGDAFTAALIAALLRGWPLDRAGKLANEVGARVAARRGAMPNLRGPFADLLSSIGDG